jgi:hypothetical protein
MPVTVTAIDLVPLLEDDPTARASYRMTVRAGGEEYHLLFTVVVVPFGPEFPEGLPLLHSHSHRAIHELVPRHFDFEGHCPLYRLVFAVHEGKAQSLPILITDRGLISITGEA